MKLIPKVTGIFDHTNNLLAFLTGVLMVFMMLSISSDVAMRYLLNQPIFWLLEVTEYGLLYITFLSTA